jgi:hypothetical protein
MRRDRTGQGSLAIIPREYAGPELARYMDSGCHYDYKAQVWMDGHDHVHVIEGTGPRGRAVVYCGADLASCQG